jgi:eukaryotic-like serine/threonine-protein kinase
VNDNNKGRGLLSWLRGNTAVDKAESPATPVATPVALKPLTNEVSLRYTDEGELARGGMGSIRRVVDENLNRRVAMKVLFPEHRNNANIVRRFAEEAQIMGQLEHPNIVPVHDYGEDDSTRYFTMLFVHGQTLSKRIEARPTPFTHEDLYPFLQIFLKVCDALAFAHSRGVVHRDLKPDNIMIGNFGEVYLMDWGIAKLLHRSGGEPMPSTTLAMPAIGTEWSAPIEVRTDGSRLDERGQVLGTFDYMAPEQATADHASIDERTDIFLLGGVLYEILTKQPPYIGSTVIDLVKQAQRCEILRPEMVAPEANIPKAIADLCMRCLRKDPQERFSSVLALKQEIDQFLRNGASFPTRAYAAGELLLQEGDLGDELFVVESGTVQVYVTDAQGRRRGIATLGQGAVVGEAGVLTASARTASVVAINDVTVRVITRKQLEQGMGPHAWLGGLVRGLAQRFAQAQQRQTTTADENASLQIINWVLQYLVMYGHTGPSGRREVEWSHLETACVAQFQRPAAEVRFVLLATKAFVIDEARNRVWFTPQPA